MITKTQKRICSRNDHGAQHAMATHECDGDMRQWCKEQRKKGFSIFSSYGVSNGTPVYEGDRGPLTYATAVYEHMINWF